ncbi:MAG: hypothetical protein ACNI3C_10410 [Candidatus Marinarcus sp.]|uniref:hypothetical protein n=1 Tax=Candidatus Marinarcus sp. TaxID=3100987 RepID=UPI003B00A2C5
MSLNAYVEILQREKNEFVAKIAYLNYKREKQDFINSINEKFPNWSEVKKRNKIKEQQNLLLSDPKIKEYIIKAKVIINEFKNEAQREFLENSTNKMYDAYLKRISSSEFFRGFINIALEDKDTCDKLEKVHKKYFKFRVGVMQSITAAFIFPFLVAGLLYASYLFVEHEGKDSIYVENVKSFFDFSKNDNNKVDK